jgi:ACT domain-containing protein
LRLELEVELRDTPGQLSLVLDQIGAHGGNVQSVVHRRGDARGEWVPVRVVLDIAPDRAVRLLDRLKRDVRILSAGGEAQGHPFPFMLVGHVFDNRLEDFLNALEAEACRVHRVQAETRGRAYPSAVFVDVTAPGADELRSAIVRLEAMARERDLLLLKGLPLELETDVYPEPPTTSEEGDRE